MPNTLCHIALQTPLSRALVAKADLRLIVLACIIPDIPWICQRLVLQFHFADPYPIQLFFIVQASLAFSCLLAAALAVLTTSPGRTFALLAGNCLLHLLLDALQIKWANGVHLFAPFDWTMLRFDLLWPEHPLWKILSLIGLITLVVLWRKTIHTPLPSLRLNRGRVSAATLLLLLYLLGPLAFLAKVEAHDNAFLHTLRARAERPGKYIEFDRLPYSAEDKQLTTILGETIHLVGRLPAVSGLISVQGQFITADQVMVASLRQHSPFRDYASYLGLFMACALWLWSVNIARKRQPLSP